MRQRVARVAPAAHGTELRLADPARAAQTAVDQIVGLLRQRLHPRLQLADLVHERLAEPLKVADLASAADCSEGQLERRMKRVFGLTATQYVLRARVDRAAAWLVDTDRPIAEIAAECGFSDQANLTRQFGRLIGETPARFRAGRSERGEDA